MVTISPPQGWYHDNINPQLLRWWDGFAWTPHTRPSTPPAPEPTPIPTPFAVIVPSTAPNPEPVLESDPEPEAEATSLLFRAEPVFGVGQLAVTEERVQQDWRQRRFLIPVGVAALIILALLMLVGSGSTDVSAGATVDSATSDDGAPVEGPTSEILPLLGSHVDDTTSSTVFTSATDTAVVEPVAVETSNDPPASTTTAPTTAASSVTTASTTPATSVATAVEAVAAVESTAVPSTAVPATTVPATTGATATTALPTTATGSCHPAYAPCLPNLPRDAVNCGDLTAEQKPVTVLDSSNDPYRLDADNDGVGCESG